MTVELTTLQTWSDDKGNRVEYDGPPLDNVHIVILGSGNRLTVAPQVRLTSLYVRFDCDNGEVSIGRSHGVPAFSARMRVGQDSRILVGDNVSSTGAVDFSAVEGTTISVGDDVMFASHNLVRADDGHPIFDVRTKRRVNTSRDITVGDHVWVAWSAALLGGTTIGNGSVVGMSAVAKGRFPNNCVIAGVPARVVRTDIAWERPHLSLTKPFYKPTASSVPRSDYWAYTADGWRGRVRAGKRGLRARVGRVLRPFRRRG